MMSYDTVSGKSTNSSVQETPAFRWIPFQARRFHPQGKFPVGDFLVVDPVSHPAVEVVTGHVEDTPGAVLDVDPPQVVLDAFAGLLDIFPVDGQAFTVGVGHQGFAQVKHEKGNKQALEQEQPHEFPHGDARRFYGREFLVSGHVSQDHDQGQEESHGHNQVDDLRYEQFVIADEQRGGDLGVQELVEVFHEIHGDENHHAGEEGEKESGIELPQQVAGQQQHFSASTAEFWPAAAGAPGGRFPGRCRGPGKYPGFPGPGWAATWPARGPRNPGPPGPRHP